MFFIDFGKRKGMREKERERGRETSSSGGERNIDGLPPVHILTWDWTRNLEMCPDQESILKPFGVWVNTPTNGATQPGCVFYFFIASTNMVPDTWST